MKYKEIKRRLKITNEDVAEMFGYKNLSAFTTSTAKPRIEKGIEVLYQRIVEQLEKEQKKAP